jgi:hypothetical protein
VPSVLHLPFAGLPAIGHVTMLMMMGSPVNRGPDEPCVQSLIETEQAGLTRTRACPLGLPYRTCPAYPKTESVGVAIYISDATSGRI